MFSKDERVIVGPHLTLHLSDKKNNNNKKKKVDGGLDSIFKT